MLQPLVTQLHEVFQEADKVYVVVEYCTGGDLVDRTLKEAGLHNDERAFDEPVAALYVL